MTGKIAFGKLISRDEQERTKRLVSLALIVLAVLVAYPYIPGSQSAAFKGVSLFLGVLVSLGSIGLVSNIITGRMLTYMDAFEVGHPVQIGDSTAYVKKKSLLTTWRVTRKNEMITMPNSYITHFDLGLMSTLEARKQHVVLPVDLMWVALSDDKGLPVNEAGIESISVRIGQFTRTSESPDARREISM